MTIPMDFFRIFLTKKSDSQMQSGFHIQRYTGLMALDMDDARNFMPPGTDIIDFSKVVGPLRAFLLYNKYGFHYRKEVFWRRVYMKIKAVKHGS